MSQFADSLHEVFAALGRVQIRGMFGGHGVFHDGLMCALVVRDTLYLKCDAPTQPHFEAMALEPFTYERQGKRMPMSYRQAPESVFEDREAAALWARRAFEAALRTANAKPNLKSKPKPGSNPSPRSGKTLSGAGSFRKPAAAKTVAAKTAAAARKSPRPR